MSGPLPSLVANDDGLVAYLDAAAEADPDLWTAPDRDPREDAHAIFSYPAMMVPRVQRALIEAVLSVQPGVRTLYDPFVGAGSSLIAAMPLGLHCTGRDINPLALLVTRVKTGPYHCDSFERYAAFVVDEARSDESEDVLTDFENHGKWFQPRVTVELSRLRRAIRRVSHAPARRFLWVTLAETVRLTSNDRTSTFKLHARPDDEIASRDLSPVDKFEELVARHVEDLRDFRGHLEQEGHLTRSRYDAEIAVGLHDVAAEPSAEDTPDGPYDLLVTSPPYGDNHTTVPYGQHSYLPLQWIDLEDIHPDVDPHCLRTTKEIDRRSLGGLSPSDLAATVKDLSIRSAALKATFERLAPLKRDRTARVASFYNDLGRAFKRIVSSLRPDAYLVFTLGNRNVGGGEIPNDTIVSELLKGLGVVEVTRFKRQILGKRMPVRNKTTSTMKEEDILIFRKVRSNAPPALAAPHTG